MNVIWYLTLVLFVSICAGGPPNKKTTVTTKKPKKIHPRVISEALPCEFSWDSKFGYACRVANFSVVSSSNPNITYITNISKVIGKHLHEGIKFHERHDFDVYRLSFWKLTVHYLPANTTLHFTKLRTLQVKDCGLKALNRSTDFIHLRRLYLGFNEIKEIPTTYFWHFCHLEVLSLFQNQISSIPLMAFRDLIRLKRLSLNGNRLRALDSRLFANCVSMEVVDLDNNELRAIDGNLFATLMRLRKIYLNNNQLDFIESHFLQTLSTFVVAELSNNPCIDFSLPEDGEYQRFQRYLIKYCSPPAELTTEPVITTTMKPRKKPEYDRSPIIYMENCKWNVREGFQEMYKNFLAGLE